MLGQVAAAGLVLAFSAALGRAQGPVAVWVESSLARIAATDSPGTARDVELTGARGEVQSFQIAVRSSTPGTTVDGVSFTDFSDGLHPVIPAANAAVYVEHFVHVSQGSPDNHGTNRPLGAGWYADALLPLPVPPLTAGLVQPLWVDVSVPRDAAPGSYYGAYTVSAGGQAVTGTVHLTVWHFTLPLRPALKSSFGIEDDDHRAAIEVELLKNRLAPAVPTVENERIYADELGLAAAGLGVWSGANISNCSMSPAPSVRQFQRQARKHQPDLMLYDFPADEINACTNLYDALKAWARNMHAAGIANLVTMTPTAELFDDGSGTGRPAVDIWVLLPVMYERAPDAVAMALRKGHEVWSYNTLAQDGYSPKWLVDYTPVNFRVQPGFLNQSLGLTGLLYWRVDFWLGPQWDSVDNTGVFGDYNAPGDGKLVYALEDIGLAGVAPSMRLKWLRDGVQDYDYVELLKGQGLGDWAKAVVQQAYRGWRDWSQDAQVLLSIREQLGRRLDELGNSGN